MKAIAQTLVQALFVLLFPPLMLGVITKTKAAFAGRVGAPFLQPYYDLVKLFRKGSVFSRTTTWVFRAGPVVSVATAVLAAALVPVGGQPALVSFEGDFLMLAYLLGLARFFTVAAALDTGSAFEGMGGAREATFACLAEPALILGLVALGRSAGSLSLSEMLGPGLTQAWGRDGASFVMVAAALFVVLLAENSRIPVDDPNTHLELTMIHEAMVLEYSARHLALIEWAAALKLFNYAGIGIALFLPWGIVRDADPAGLAGAVVALALKLGAFGLALALVETFSAKMRIFRAPEFLGTAFMLAVLGMLVRLLLGA